MIGVSYKIPKASVINFVMNEKEDEELGKQADPAHTDAAG